MIKNLLIAVAALGLLGAVNAPAQGRIATVDLKRVFDGYWKTKQADAALKDRAGELEKDHKAMLADYNKAKDQYKVMLAAAADSAISDAERTRKKKEAEETLVSLKGQEESIVKFETQARTTLDEQRRRMRDNLLGEVRKTIDGRAKGAGYSLVIDVAGESQANTPIVLFTNGENDITDAVLTQLNITAPPEALATDKKADPKKEDAAK
jgi:outer membrane protein